MLTVIAANTHLWPDRRRRLRFLILGVASLLLLGLGSQSIYAVVHAAGEDIHIVSESQKINFPDEVDFELTVESTSEITEIRLLFRSLGSRVCTGIQHRTDA